MSKPFKVSVKVDTSTYKKVLGKMNVDIVDCFRELIDNSTSSFNDHYEELHRVGEQLCKVQINWDDDCLVVIDNAFGMNRNDFERSFGIARTSSSYSQISRSANGIGLKYSAMSFGMSLCVETTELNSGKLFRGTLDAELLNTTLGEEIEAREDDCDPSRHGTKIVISNLVKERRFSKFNTKGKNQEKLDELLKKIGRIYSDDFKNGKLEVVINNRKVNYQPPIYRKNPETGSEYFFSVSDTFEYDGESYSYGGFIGWLETGDTYSAGLSLKQKGRAVKTSYRPKKMFGDQKTYRSQRIYGEINLEGDNWKISFTKNGVQWDNELEEKFIDSIISCENIPTLLKEVDAFRNNKQNIQKKQLDKLKIKDLESVEQHGKKKSVEKREVTHNVENNVKEDLADKSAVVPEPIIHEQDEGTTKVFSFGGVDYLFHLIPKNYDEMQNNLFKLKKNDENEYTLLLNTKVSAFKQFKSAESNLVIAKMIVVMILGEFSSKRIGVNLVDIETINKCINDIAGNIE